MARKRMISPEIWESQDFSALSDLAKIVFISLFSHADDEGRGRADPTFIKNSTFPYDENRRVADIKSALSEIARSMSVQFYNVNGIEYYFMTNWERWQKVEKPSKSKFPPPPVVGEGGDIHSIEKFGERSGNSRGIVGEVSTTNIIEDNRIKNNITHSAGAREENEFERQFNVFCKKWNVEVDNYSPLLDEIDFCKLDTAYEESTKFLQVAPVARTISWVIKNLASIYAGKYKDTTIPAGGKRRRSITEDWASTIAKLQLKDGNGRES